MLKIFLTRALSVLLIAGISLRCDSASTPDDEGQVYVVRAGGGETFKIQVNDPERIAEADSLLAGGIAKIVHGQIRAGDGGFNAPYNWHLDPDSITFPDATIELCDGRPSAIGEDLDYWINTVRYYCPWGAQIVGKE